MARRALTNYQVDDAAPGVPVVLYDANGNAILGGGNDVVASGTLGALNDALAVTCKNGLQTVLFQSDSGLTGTVTVQATNDDSTWYQYVGIDPTGKLVQNTGSTFQRLLVVAAGRSQVRVIVTAYTGGSTAVRARASYGLAALWLAQ